MTEKQIIGFREFSLWIKIPIIVVWINIAIVIFSFLFSLFYMIKSGF